MKTKLLNRTILFIIISIISIIFLAPLVWMITSAFRPADKIFSYLSVFSWKSFVPVDASLINFKVLFSGLFPRAVFNSLFVAFFTVTIGLFISSTAAFGISVFHFKGRELVFSIIVIAFLIPFTAISIPLADLFRRWGLENTFIGLILPGVANGMTIFLIRQFFLTIPKDFSEAAKIDGANWFRIYREIYVPLAVPSHIGGGLLLFMWQWQSYMWPLLVVTDQKMDVATVALAKYLGQFEFDFGQMFAGAVTISIIPMIIMFFLQRYFVQSMVTSGAKG